MSIVIAGISVKPLLLLLLMAVFAVIAVIAAQRWHRESGGTGAPGEENKETAPPQPDPDTLRRDLARRNELEEGITRLILGDTGMNATWELTVQSARDGDDSGFLTYGSSFSRKAEKLKGLWEELTGLLHRYEQYPKAGGESELLRQLQLKDAKAPQCRTLLQRQEALTKDGLLGQREIDPETLSAWYHSAAWI